MHGAGAPQVRRAAARRVATMKAVSELERLGIPVTTDPLDALLNQVYEAAGNVAFLRERVAELRQTYTGVDEIIPGIAGPDHLGDGARHILVRMYDEERDRLARMAKLCLEAGVAERRVALAERQGELLAQVIRAILADLNLSKGQRAKVPGIVRKHLTAVAAGAA